MKVGTEYYFYQNDHLGTPQKMTTVSGAVVWSAKYSSFGKAQVDAASTVVNNLRFPGQLYDEETGLHYNWMRYYDSQTGRYVKTDPYGIIPFGPHVGLNPLYQYVLNNSTNFYDISGEIPPQLITGVLAGLGNLAYQLYKNGGRLECVNFWEVGSWALTGAGAGSMLRGGLTGIRQFFWNKNYSKLAGSYWKAKGGAFKQWYGVGNLDHWAISRAAAKSGGIKQGLGNAGWNLLETPARLNHAIGMRGWMSPTAQKIARIGVSATVPATVAAGAYVGYQIGTKAQEDKCGCE